MHKFHTLRLTSVERENEQKNRLNCGSVARVGRVDSVGWWLAKRSSILLRALSDELPRRGA